MRARRAGLRPRSDFLKIPTKVGFETERQRHSKLEALKEELRLEGSN